MTNLLHTIDWEALKHQKLALISVIPLVDRRTAHRLDGLLHLLDAIQDEAEKQGLPVVWAEEADQ